jgi:hypothetical protein
MLEDRAHVERVPGPGIANGKVQIMPAKHSLPRANPTETEPAPSPAGPPRWARWLISVLVLAHFFAILTAVTGAGSQNYPAPPTAVKLGAYVTRPYLHMTFLNNPYRFYAPNPSPPNILWFRIKYEDGTVRWVEVPRKFDYPFRLPYQRHLALTLLFDQFSEPAIPTIEEPLARQLSPEGRIAIASYIRHVARRHQRLDEEGKPQKVEIQFYNVYHQIMDPWQIRQGWQVMDLRTYAPAYYGTFNGEGVQIDKGTSRIQNKPISELTAFALATDIYPVFRAHPDTDRAELLRELGIPTPICALLVQFPELRNPDLDTTNLRQHLVKLIQESTQNPQEKKAPAFSAERGM